MNKLLAGLALLVLAMLLGSPIVVRADAVPENVADIVAKLDAKLFDAYNRCDLVTMKSMLDEHVEFYHDKGGVTWTAQEVIDATQRNICGKVRREVVPGTLFVSPIKDFGAFETVDHQFCEIEGGKCVGQAKAAMLWRLKDGVWQLTRIFSYDHAPTEPSAH